MFTQANKNYEKKQSARNAVKKQIQNNLKILIKLLKEKGGRGILNSTFGNK